MSDILTQLKNNLLAYSHKKEGGASLHCLSAYHCIKSQKIQRVSFIQPTILMVVKGYKQAKINDQVLTIKTGDFLLLPPDATLWIGNFPDTQERQYLGLAFRFDQEALRSFRQVYGSSIENWDISARWHSKVPETIITLLKQWLEWEQLYSTDLQLIQHRQIELLLLLAQAGLAGNILLGEHPSWKHRVTQLLCIDPARAWEFNDVCSRLGVSGSSLRRKLQSEQTNFRELLEEVRLSMGLSLLLETKQSIGQVAGAVGYQSQSRFGERFKRRFDLSPSELRRTLVT